MGISSEYAQGSRRLAPLDKRRRLSHRMIERQASVTTRLPHSSSQVFLVIELEHFTRNGTSGVGAVISLPNRDGTLTREWKAPYGVLDASQAQDLSNWVAQATTNALTRWSGIQGTLLA
jgi:hypothetical protein